MIDSPPVMTVTDARIIAGSVDATLLVVRMKQTSRDAASAAADILQVVGANVLGVIVNDVAAGKDRYGYCKGGYEGPRALAAPPDGRHPGMDNTPTEMEATITV